MIFLRLFLKGRKAPAYRKRWKERLGYLPKSQIDKLHTSQAGVIWIHSASLGETRTAVPLVRYLQSACKSAILITTITPTGSSEVISTFGGSVCHSYCPLDLSGAIRRFYKTIRPRLIVLVERELWPNLMHIARYEGVPVFLANARLPEPSFNRYCKIKSLTQHMLSACQAIAAQSSEDRDRFIHLGALKDTVQTTGSLKWHVQVATESVDRGQALRKQLLAHSDQLIWIAASTHPGEEALILDGLSYLHKRLGVDKILLLLVPRHVERAEYISKLIEQRGLRLKRHSDLSQPQKIVVDVFLGDTLGRLVEYYSASDIAFVAGNLFEGIGGHNVVEPAALGLPIVSGPYFFKNKTVYHYLQQQGGLTVVHDVHELCQTMEKWIVDTRYRVQQGQRALKAFKQQQSALQNHIVMLEKLLHGL